VIAAIADAPLAATARAFRGLRRAGRWNLAHGRLGHNLGARAFEDAAA